MRKNSTKLFQHAFRSKLLLRFGVPFIAVILLMLYAVFISPPRDYPEQLVLTIEEGETLSAIADLLREEKVIASPFLLKLIVRLGNSDTSIQAGDYYFNERRPVFRVAKMITEGEYGLVPLRVTVFEGSTVREIPNFFDERFRRFDAESFVKKALPHEGYLFPDTYFFLPNVTEQQVIDTMRKTFDERIESLSSEIDAFGKPLEEVVIMASLLEKEARQLETRRTIAGILWKRIAIGMPLQVDAVFPYIIGKNTYEVTLEDLETDSPYNTYRYAGLPIGPIANPGLDSLLAAVTPIESGYLYYLSDRGGNTYYSASFEGHKRNRVLYLE